MLESLALVFAFASAPLMGLGLWGVRRVSGFNRRAVQAQATVVGHATRMVRPASGGRHQPFVQLELSFVTRDGRRVRRGAEELLDPRRVPVPPVGSQLPLSYDSARPDDISLSGPRGRAGVASKLLQLGVVLALAAIALWVKARMR